jgi:hypothetical protein
VEFGEWLCEEVLNAIPHRHFVFSIPKILRRYFLYDRKLLSDLSRCGWDSLKIFSQEAVPEEDPVLGGKESAVPGAVIAIQSFGDFLGFNPHLHVLCTDGCFYGNGMFRVAPRFEAKGLEEIFRHKVFRMLLSKGKITEDLVNMLMKWRHSGFNVFRGPRIQPGEEKAMEYLARYIIRASFSQERMTYIPDESKVVYRSKDDNKEKVFDALEWLAAMCSHVPNKGEQMVRYYKYYSNVSRGKRKQANQDERIACILEPVGSSREYRKNWVRLIQKIYEVDPLICPKCSGAMKVISVIEDEEVVKKILKHLGLWDVKPRPPPGVPAAVDDKIILRGKRRYRYHRHDDYTYRGKNDLFHNSPLSEFSNLCLISIVFSAGRIGKIDSLHDSDNHGRGHSEDDDPIGRLECGHQSPAFVKQHVSISQGSEGDQGKIECGLQFFDSSHQQVDARPHRYLHKAEKQHQ